MAVSKKASLMLIVAGTALWGIIGIFTRALLSDGISPIQIAMVRCLITATVLGLFILLFKRDRFRIDVKDIWMFFGTGILSIAFFNICYFTAMDYLTISLASVLLYTSPYFVLIMSMILFKEKLTKRKVLALLMAFSGCMFSTGVFTGFEGISMVGLMFGILSGFGYALYTIFGNYALRKYDSLTVTFYTFLIAFIALAPFSDIPQVADVVASNSDVLINFLILGVGITLIPYFLYTEGLKGLEPGIASIVAFTEPMVATIVGFLILGESLSVFGILGILLILTSIVILGLGDRSDTCSEVK